MDAVGLDPVDDVDAELATERARLLFAAACNASAHQPGLPLHERAGYLALRREAVRLAHGETEPPAVWRIDYNEQGCAEPDTSIGSRTTGERMYVSDPHKVPLTTAETGALLSIVDHLWEQAQQLPPTSRVRAWLLKIRLPLATFVGVRPLRPAQTPLQQHPEHLEGPRLSM